ncbi:MAG: AAA family ATPase [Alphaproteobacteria bacterium]|nr:AAA family ATPase [Alphaproteobacteria bacterium]MBU0799146.1 AAA family ATPase [Alphaproteobacteria bacterium]MBU0888825.1 AAA family ATPase [Alphaproteobacteria bacterium]MBU1813845.1 AAA family ATPase [Alphaproteobacteria bacterium]
MSAKELPAGSVGLPRFAPTDDQQANAFDFTSHKRAREALEFALGIDDMGFNVFVLGEDRSGRMTATLRYLEDAMEDRPAPPDWVILNNFRQPHEPLPFRLPPGQGRAFRAAMAALVKQVAEALKTAFTGDDYQGQIRQVSERIQGEVNERLVALREKARAGGLDIVQTEKGIIVTAPPPEETAKDLGEPQPGKADTEQAPVSPPVEKQAAAQKLLEELGDINRWASERQHEMAEWVANLNRSIADDAIAGPVDALTTEFGMVDGLRRWLIEMRQDMLDNLAAFHPPKEGERRPALMSAERRYAVNLFVDHAEAGHPDVVLEPNPTYENLFGRIEYRQAAGTMETDFTLVRPGSLHRANGGGVLVLRAEALAADASAWTFLKGALRDRCIQIEERYRAGSVPISGAPHPRPIPLDLKVVIVGAPNWYYTFFTADPAFQAYFKVKADIDADMPASAENIACYSGLIREMAAATGGISFDESGISRLLGEASRLAANRDKLTARFELIDDIVTEAAHMPRPKAKTKGKDRVLGAAEVEAAIANRQRRNARVEDRMQESIARGALLIDTEGTRTGQINALVVRDLGDHAFGAPARVTARASVGRKGVTNIERDVAMGGPIQQKGVMVLQGFLAGLFAQKHPLSFSCSITFEQSYGGVEGDSASLAELVAILSDLSGLPVRQDRAITGSVNQHGHAQAIGGGHHKIEGFFRTCLENGKLSGTQGVVVPAANEPNLVLSREVEEAIAAGQFHVWSIAHIDEALPVFLDTPAKKVYALAAAKLEEFDRLLRQREEQAGD